MEEPVLSSKFNILIKTMLNSGSWDAIGRRAAGPWTRCLGGASLGRRVLLPIAVAPGAELSALDQADRLEGCMRSGRPTRMRNTSMRQVLFASVTQMLLAHVGFR